jgi:hypothetical protein
LKAKELLQKTADLFQLRDPNDRTIVVAPTHKFNGRIVHSNDTVELTEDEVKWIDILLETVETVLREIVSLYKDNDREIVA